MIERRQQNTQTPPNRHLRRIEDRPVIAAMPTHELFHRLWTNAVGSDDYVKAEWLELQRRVERL